MLGEHLGDLGDERRDGLVRREREVDAEAATEERQPQRVPGRDAEGGGIRGVWRRQYWFLDIGKDCHALDSSFGAFDLFCVVGRFGVPLGLPLDVCRLA